MQYNYQSPVIVTKNGHTTKVQSSSQSGNYEHTHIVHGSNIGSLQNGGYVHGFEYGTPNIQTPIIVTKDDHSTKVQSSLETGNTHVHDSNTQSTSQNGGFVHEIKFEKPVVQHDDQTSIVVTKDGHSTNVQSSSESENSHVVHDSNIQSSSQNGGFVHGFEYETPVVLSSDSKKENHGHFHDYKVEPFVIYDGVSKPIVIQNYEIISGNIYILYFI